MDPMNEPPAPDAPTPDQSAAKTTPNTGGAGLVTLAGMALIVIYLIFDLLLDDWGIGLVTLMLAVIAVIVPRLKHETAEKFARASVILKVVGYGFGLILVFDILGIIDNGFPEGAMSVIGALVSLAALAVGFVGARQIDI
jgi:hypothetical protein